MKRRLIVTIVVTVLVLLLGAACEVASARIASAYKQDISRVGGALDTDDWPAALQFLDETEQKWDKQNVAVQLWVNHADTDHITLGLKRLRAALLAGDKSSALSQYFELMENFGHLHHRDAFTLKNIL